MTRAAPKQRPRTATALRARSRRPCASRQSSPFEAKTIAEAAARCGIRERTLRRWLTEDRDFQQQYETARAAAFERGLHRVQALMGRAVDTLETLLAATAAPQVQLGAARTIAELALHQWDAQTILRKLTEIEQAQRSRLR